MIPYLVAATGLRAGEKFPIIGPLTIGRSEDNSIPIDDRTASRHHCTIYPETGGVWLKDGQASNGTLLNGTEISHHVLQHGDRIQAGSTTFIYIADEESPDALLRILKSEADQNRRFDTLQNGHKARELIIRLEGDRNLLVEIPASFNAIHDPRALAHHILNMGFELVHARRGVIAFNGPRPGPNPEDFVFHVYGERGEEDAVDFPLSSKVLEAVYSGCQTVLSNTGTPVICAPLFKAGRVCGIVYLEGGPGGFGADEQFIMKAIAGAASAIPLAIQSKADRDEYQLLRQLYADGEMVGRTPQMQKVRQLIVAVAANIIPVLILGESGTGKEGVARAIHKLSARAGKPFAGVNCGALSESLLASELYGHEKGGFTGATAPRLGKIRTADGGTIFLDEVGDMSADAQKGLLRVLQEKEVEPVGSDKAVKVDVRVIAATNVDLDEAVRQKTFRWDLLQRLNAFIIRMPALRERRDDIPLLADHFMQKYRADHDITGFTPAAMATLMAYNWLGNIRELENVVWHGIVLARTGEIGVEHLPEHLPRKHAETLDQLQRPNKWTLKTAIEARMRENGGDFEEARKWVGVSKSYGYKLLKL